MSEKKTRSKPSYKELYNDCREELTRNREELAKSKIVEQEFEKFYHLIQDAARKKQDMDYGFLKKIVEALEQTASDYIPYRYFEAFESEETLRKFMKYELIDTRVEILHNMLSFVDESESRGRRSKEFVVSALGFDIR